MCHKCDSDPEWAKQRIISRDDTFSLEWELNDLIENQGIDRIDSIEMKSDYACEDSMTVRVSTTNLWLEFPQIFLYALPKSIAYSVFEREVINLIDRKEENNNLILTRTAKIDRYYQVRWVL